MSVFEGVMVHESSYVDDNVTIGSGTKIWHFSHILGNVQIGQDCSFGQNVVIGPNVKIGNGVRVQNNVSIYDKVWLDDDVFCGPSMVFTNVMNPRAHISRKKEFKPTIVKKGATLGANCTIICGVVIGHYAFVAAGAVITKDVKSFALVTGVPGKQAGWISASGNILNLPLSGEAEEVCSESGKTYRLDGENVYEV